MLPFIIEAACKYRLLGTAIPIGSVPFVAFFAVQIGMNPRPCRTGVGLGNFVGALPITFAIPPQGLHSEAAAIGWGALVNGYFKLGGANIWHDPYDSDIFGRASHEL